MNYIKAKQIDKDPSHSFDTPIVTERRGVSKILAHQLSNAILKKYSIQLTETFLKLKDKFIMTHYRPSCSQVLILTRSDEVMTFLSSLDLQ